MSSTPRPLLSAHPEADDSTRLRREIAGLEQELREAKREAEEARQSAADAVQAISALRRQLEPLHKSLKMIFGEISRVDAGKETGEPSASENTSRFTNAKLEMMKRQLGGRQAEFIEFLQHGEMTTAELAAAAHCHRDTVAQVILKLNRAGLIEKNGNKFSLKDL